MEISLCGRTICSSLVVGRDDSSVEFYYRICEGEPYCKVEPFAAHSLSREYQELAYLRFIEGQQYNPSGCRELVLDNLEVDDIPDSIRDSIIESYLDAAREAETK